MANMLPFDVIEMRHTPSGTLQVYLKRSLCTNILTDQMDCLSQSIGIYLRFVTTLPML